MKHGRSTGIVQSSILANREGVKRLQTGDVVGAICEISVGLESLLWSLSPTAMCPNPPAMRFGTKFFSSIPLPDNYIQDDTFLLYNRALDVSSEAAAILQDFALEGHLLVASMLYNLALSYHLLGLMHGNSGNLSVAFDLYSVANHILCTHAPANMQESVSSNLARLSIANNAGHIHAHFRRFKDVRFCMSVLVQCLLAACHVPAVGNIVISNDEETKVFYLNACFVQESGYTPAPAA